MKVFQDFVIKIYIIIRVYNNTVLNRKFFLYPDFSTNEMCYELTNYVNNQHLWKYHTRFKFLYQIKSCSIKLKIIYFFYKIIFKRRKNVLKFFMILFTRSIGLHEITSYIWNIVYRQRNTEFTFKIVSCYV